MKILDSNIIIYATQSAYTHLAFLLYEPDAYISEITKLEVLGYHGFDTNGKQNMTDLFDSLKIIPIDSTIIDKAVELRPKLNEVAAPAKISFHVGFMVASYPTLSK